jgi:hypothetical protein
VRTQQTTNLAVGRLDAPPREAAVNPPADPEPDAADNASDRVTAAQIVSAHEVVQIHRRVCVPEPVCNWCLKKWPCPDIASAWYTLPNEE